jgi:WD40 repeat protein
MDESRVDRWLSQWEAQPDRGAVGAMEQFIAQHCADAPPDLLEQFKSKARALQAIDADLARANRDRTDVGDLDLKPGCEPAPGYRLIARLGRGGFGEVWRASAPGDIQVALKFILLEAGASKAELRSLDIIKSVRHPHLLALSAKWQERGYLILAMDLADCTLLDRFQESRAQGHAGIPRHELLGYMTEAAEGIDYLNEPIHPGENGQKASIIHRDIKPQNLLLVAGHVKVGDFGLARLLERTTASHSGSMTAEFAAPEFFNRKSSRHSDQYSLAVTYCILRGGRVPFEGSSAEVMAGHLGHPPDLSMLPEPERAVVARALAKEPGGRWPSCQAFVEGLRKTAITDQDLGGSQVSSSLANAMSARSTTSATSATEPLTRSSPRLSRYRIIVATGAVLVIGLLCWLLFGSPRNTATQDRKESAATDIAAKKSPAPADTRATVNGPKANPVDAPKANNPVGEIHCLRGHSAAVNMVAFSPDAKRVVSGSDDRTAIIWDVASEKPIHKLDKHSGPVKSVAFSPNGDQVLSGGGYGDHAIILWDAKTGQEVRRLHGHQHGVRGLAFLPNGKQAVSCSFDGTVRLWNLEDGKELRRFPGFDQPNLNAVGKQVWCVAVSGDGKRLACGVRDRTARVFDIETNKEVKIISGHRTIVNTVALDHSGHRLLSAAGDIFEDGGVDRTVRVWDVDPGQLLKENPSPVGKIWSVAWTPDRKRALIVGEDRSVVLWDPESGKEIRRFSGHTAEVFGVAFSADGQFAVTGSADNTVRVWKLPE